MTRIIRFGADCLAGIPSIIFGLFGFIFFVTKLGFGWSILTGGLTLAFMILPTIIRTSEEAIRAVPAAYREVSFSLGSTRWQMVTRVVLPAALPGIVTGHHPEHRPEHRRDGGRHLHGRQRPSHPHVRLLLLADHGGPFLHPGPGRDLDGQRLRDGRRAVISILDHQRRHLLPHGTLHTGNTRDRPPSGSGISATGSWQPATLRGITLDIDPERDPGDHRAGREREIDVPRRPQPDERPRPGLPDRGPHRDRRKGHLRSRGQRRRAPAEARHGLRDAGRPAALDLRERRLRAAAQAGARRKPSSSGPRPGLPGKGGALGRGQGPARYLGPQPLRRAAAAALHRPGPGPEAGGHPPRRAVLGPRPDLDREDRGCPPAAEVRVHDHPRDQQHQAGGPGRRPDGLLPHRRAGRDRGRRSRSSPLRPTRGPTTTSAGGSDRTRHEHHRSPRPVPLLRSVPGPQGRQPEHRGTADHGPHRPVGLREVDVPPDPQPDERPHRRRPHQRARSPSTASTSTGRGPTSSLCARRSAWSSSGRTRSP